MSLNQVFNKSTIKHTIIIIAFVFISFVIFCLGRYYMYFILEVDDYMHTPWKNPDHSTEGIVKTIISLAVLIPPVIVLMIFSRLLAFIIESIFYENTQETKIR